MDERQTQIKEGAGLEESRINQEFVDFLNKWSTPVLVLIVIISGGWWAYQRYRVAQTEKVNAAFSELTALTSADNPNPESLAGLAETYAGVRSVPMLAKLRAADVYLASVQRGVALGAELGPDGTPTEEGGLLTDEDRQFNLERAERLYRQVLDETRGTAGKSLLALNAAGGLAVVMESRGDLDAARAMYNDAIAIADEHGFGAISAVMSQRLEELDSIPELMALPPRADLPELPGTVSERIDLPGPSVIEGPVELPDSSLSLPGSRPAEETGDAPEPAETEPPANDDG